MPRTRRLACRTKRPHARRINSAVSLAAFVYLDRGNVGQTTKFPCKNFIGDSQADCDDKSDENMCGISLCPKDHFKCDNGRCVFNSWLCDGENDCGMFSNDSITACLQATTPTRATDTGANGRNNSHSSAHSNMWLARTPQKLASRSINSATERITVRAGPTKEEDAPATYVPPTVLDANSSATTHPTALFVLARTANNSSTKRDASQRTSAWMRGLVVNGARMRSTASLVLATWSTC